MPTVSLPGILCLITLLGAPSALVSAEHVKPVRGSLFQPGKLPSLGKLSVASGQTVTFDTGTATSEPSVSGAVTGTASLGLSATGSVEVAIFAFDSIALAEGATVVVTGDRGLVLVSKGAISVDSTVDLSGKPGSKLDRKAQIIGTGGPGAEGGEYGKTLSSAPPPVDGGDGGPPMKDNGKPGRGFGAGFNQRVKGGTAGGGGAYGGAGGESSIGSEGGGIRGNRPMPGGTVYGDEALADLYGGSGGAGASNDRAFTSGGGGGGGGAIELVSLVSITVGPKGRILAVGGAGGVEKGCGGGGSGGAILLAAPSIVLKEGALVDASGGIGGSGKGIAEEAALGKGRRQNASGGGGGGGRVAFYGKEDFAKSGKNRVENPPPKGVAVAGAKGGDSAKDGADGTFYDGTLPGLK